MQAKKTCAHKPSMPQSTSAHETTINNRSAAQQTTRTNWVPSPRVCTGLDLGIMARPPEQLPDPWLFDSEKLLNELGRIAELVDQIPIADSHATHFAINRAAQAIYDLREHLRFLLHLHREGQHQFSRKAAEQSASVPPNTGALAQPISNRGRTGRPRKTSAAA